MGSAQVQNLSGFTYSLDSLATHDAFSGRVLVAQGSNKVFDHAAGLAHRRPDRPPGPDTRFQLASLTKQFTAALVLKLHEEGQLSLHETMGTYLPWYPAAYRDSVTLHHLLTHQSGIPNYTGRPDWPALSKQVFKPRTFGEEIIASKTLEFQPGSHFSYSNSNYYLLGLVAEEVTSQRYADLLEKHLLDPLNMVESGTLDEWGQPGLDLATGYERLPNGFVEEAPRQDYSTAFSVSGMYSSPEDLLCWSRALLADEILPDSLRRLMLTPHTRGYGYGLVISQVEFSDIARMIRQPFSGSNLQPDGGHKIIWHWGSNPGYNTLFLLLPEEDITVIILENLTRLESSRPTRIPELAQEILGRLLK